jgi:transposase
MAKKYIVRLSEEERDSLRQVIKKLKGSSQKVRRAQILLKADLEGANWTDKQIAAAFECRTKTVENIRRRLVEEGLETTLSGVQRMSPPRPKLLDGEQEAHIIAMRLGEPPNGYANWSLRLLSRKVVELGLVESVSHETIRTTLKKMA